MTRVLIAVDDTDGSYLAAKTAHHLFGDDAQYTVISVASSAPVYWGNDPLGQGTVYPLAVPPASVVGGMPLLIDVPDDRAAQPIELAEQTAQQVAVGAGINSAHPVGAVGDPAKVIVEAAHDIDADVIVVGSHAHGWLDRLFSSSVSDKVIHKAEMPVLVAR